MNKKYFTLEYFILYCLLIANLAIALCSNIAKISEQHFSLLADSFLHGKLYFLEKLPFYGDTVFYHGQYFWPLGPFPAILLIPGQFIFKMFGHFFYQGYLNIFLGILIFILIFKICKKLCYTELDSLYLGYGFCLSSALLGTLLLPSSYHFAQTVVVFLLVLAIYEFLHKKRYWFLGIVMGLILITRFTAGLGIILFLLDIIFSKSENKAKIKNLILLVLPFTSMFVLLCLYNYFRFGGFLEQGYNLQIIKDSALANRNYGLFNFIHIPGNIFYSLINLPSPIFKETAAKVLAFPFIKADPWGMSIFLTSPYLLYLFLLKYKDKLSKFLWITIICVALPIYLYYGIGYRQFGYRYSLDFIPWLFLLLIKNYKEQIGNLSNFYKSIIIISSLFNLYLFITYLNFR
jgi:uncharacterized membrane protein